MSWPIQVLQVADPAIIAEALRNKELDKQPLSPAFNYFAGPHGLPTIFSAPSNERWKGVRWDTATNPQLFCWLDMVLSVLSEAWAVVSVVLQSLYNVRVYWHFFTY